MQRRIADEVLFDKCEWQQDFQFWESDGKLIGAAFFESDRDGALIGQPGHPELIDPMLEWPEARYRAKGSAEPLMIEAMESNTLLGDRLREKGCPLATVQSWSESPGANKLSQAAGLLPTDNQLNWIINSDAVFHNRSCADRSTDGFDGLECIDAAAGEKHD